MEIIDPKWGRYLRIAALAWILVPITGCADSPTDRPTGVAASEVSGESWSITAWGKRFEIFPEVGPLVAGRSADAHIHVTLLEGFLPLVTGKVELVLSGDTGEQVFGASEPARPGIFNVAVTPETTGIFDLLFRIHDDTGTEEIQGGKVRVGEPLKPGGLKVAPAPRGATDGGQPLPFLKEEQWRSELGTEWVRRGRIAGSVAGLARVRPAAGGDAWVSASMRGVLTSTGGPWPYPGLEVERGRPLLRLAPLVAEDRSLSTLEAQASTLGARLKKAETRLGRLEELLALEAVSRREVEQAQVEVEVLSAEHRAAFSDLESAQSIRSGAGGGAGKAVSLRAPFAGRVATVEVKPGTTVDAGDPLIRLVRTDPLWLEIALAPADADRLARLGARGLVIDDPERGPIRPSAAPRLVSVAPEMSPESGSVTVLVEIPQTPGLVLGTTVTAQILLREEREGIAIPSSAVVDDGGVSVVYLQLTGESFVRQQIRILERQGDRLLVEGLVPGQRLVSRGGAAIRRSSLMSSGNSHGHVH